MRGNLTANEREWTRIGRGNREGTRTNAKEGDNREGTRMDANRPEGRRKTTARARE